MATIQDHSNFKIKVRSIFENWWSFHFEFFYRDKPVFNSEIIKEDVFKADEYESGSLLSFLEKAIKSEVNGEKIRWGAWEEELAIEINYIRKNLNMDGGFDFIVFLSEHCFKDGEINYMFQNAGVRLFVNREELKKFYNDLKKEIDIISKEKKQKRFK